MLYLKEAIPGLISVVIPSYYQALFLKDSIESVLNQDYPLKEVIVINDGAKDDAEKVAQIYEDVIYLYQDNQGVSVARNTGLKHSSGEYIIFLDADDILLPGALSYQAEMIKKHPEVAFISGGHVHTDEHLNIVKEVSSPIKDNFYEAMLTTNYIGMHASVLYRRFVFEELAFDPYFRSSEDYDLYLKIAYKYPLYNHTKPIAGYRFHPQNTSKNLPKMLKSVLSALENQKPHLTTPEQKKAYKQGRYNWIYYYGQQMYEQLMKNPSMDQNLKKEFIFNFWKYRPKFYFKFIINKYIRHQNAF